MSWLYTYLADMLGRAKVPYDLEVITELDAIIESSVSSVPAVILDDTHPILEEDFETFRDFSDEVVRVALEPYSYGALRQIVLPILPDYDFRAGLIYGYHLASESSSILRVEPFASTDLPGEVERAIKTLELSTADVALDRAIIVFNKDKEPYRTDLVIWPYGREMKPQTAAPVLYLPTGFVYREHSTVCFHDGDQLPDLVIDLWPGVSLCHEVDQAADLIVDGKLSKSLNTPTLILPQMAATV